MVELSRGHGALLLPQGVGYGVLVGFSVFFCLFILFAVHVQKKFLKEDSGKSEMFMVANRSVSTYHEWAFALANTLLRWAQA